MRRRFSVRVAVASDAPTVGQLLHDFNQEFDAPGPTATQFSERFSHLLDRPDVVVVLANTQGRDVGFAFVTLRPTPYYDGSFAQLEELYVESSLRGQGIGASILDSAVQIAQSRGAAEMHINVDEIDEATRRFYERHGFVNIEPGKDYRMLCYVQEF